MGYKDSSVKHGPRDMETSRKTYYKEFKKVLEASDVVIQVLDARDPLGSRCPQLEQAVICAGINKKMVLLLNKIGKGAINFFDYNQNMLGDSEHETVEQRHHIKYFLQSHECN